MAHLLGLVGGADFGKISAELLTRQSGQHSISDARGKRFRPLLDSLIANLQRRSGGGNAPTEKFNCMRFVHDQLNHNSVNFAIMIHKITGKVKP